MMRIRTLYKKIPVQFLLWLKWILFVTCLIVLVFTLSEINARLLINSDVSNDFFASWYGLRVFLVEGENPYSEEMQVRVLNAAGDLQVTVDQESSFLKMPLFGIIFYLPFLFIRDFSLSFSWWLTLIEIAGVFIAILSVSLIKKNLKQNAVYVLFAVFLMLVSLFFMVDLRQGSTAVLSFLILLASMKVLEKNGDELTGVLLSLLMIFPIYGWISMLFILLWSVRQGKMNVLWWFLGTIVLFGFAVALLEPQWLLYYLRMWVRYFGTVEIAFIVNLLESLFPETFLLPWFIVGILAIIMVLEWGFAGRKDFILFYWVFQLTLVLETLLTLDISLVNFVFIPSTLIFILVSWEDRWKRNGRIVGFIVSVGVTFIPWLLNSLFVNQENLMALWTTAFVVLILMGNLYWIHWWLFRNVKLWYSDVYSLDHPGKNYEQS